MAKFSDELEAKFEQAIIDRRKIKAELQALVADWKSRQYNGPYSHTTDEQFARDQGKQEAFSDAADELSAVLQRFPE